MDKSRPGVLFSNYVSWNLNLFDYVFSQMNLTSKTENLVYTRVGILEIFKKP